MSTFLLFLLALCAGGIVLMAGAFFLIERYKNFFIEKKYLSFLAYCLLIVSSMWMVTNISVELRRNIREHNPDVAEWIPMISYVLTLIPMGLISFRINRVRNENKQQDGASGLP